MNRLRCVGSARKVRREAMKRVFLIRPRRLDRGGMRHCSATNLTKSSLWQAFSWSTTKKIHPASGSVATVRAKCRAKSSEVRVG